MLTEGYIFMFLAWGIILSLLIFCFNKVFKSERKTN